MGRRILAVGFSVAILWCFFVAPQGGVIAEGNILHLPIDATLRESVYKFQSMGGTGTAFAVSKDTAVTAAHVAKNAANILLVRDDIKIEVTAVTIISGKDLAVLHLKTEVKKWLEIDEKGTYWGQPLAIIGCPLGLQVTPTVGHNVGIKDFDGHKYLLMSCQAYPGNSGSPVVDLNSGKVIGVLVAGYPSYTQISLAEPIEGVKGVLR